VEEQNRAPNTDSFLFNIELEYVGILGDLD